jgi:flagellar biosynthesis/type III secretory pathway protein FliH
MDPLIRSAVLADDRRQLRRPQPVPAAPAAMPAPAGRAPVFATAAETVEQMRRDVEQRLADARRELEQEREAMRKTMAAEHAGALEQAARRGYEEGRQRGEADGRRALDADVARVRALLDELQQVRSQVLDAAEDTVVEIAFAAICRLAGTEAASRDVAAHAVRQACAELRTGDALTVLVHPGDLAQLVSQLERPPGVNLVASPAIGVGGCMIDGVAGTLDARLETQLDQLRLALLRVRSARHQGERA